jgi:hypothetical protein
MFRFDRNTVQQQYFVGRINHLVLLSGVDQVCEMMEKDHRASKTSPSSLAESSTAVPALRIEDTYGFDTFAVCHVLISLDCPGPAALNRRLEILNLVRSAPRPSVS